MIRITIPVLKTFLFLSLFISLSNLLFAAPPEKKETLYLSGTDNEHTVTWDFYCTGGRKSGYWSTIQVPSHWEQQGFGEYDYGRDYRTYGKDFKFSDEKGMYKYAFNVPATWKDKVVRIVFEGSMTDTEVLINGMSAGDMHQGSFYRFSYDITDKLKFGSKNMLEVTVSKMSSNNSVNHAERYADYWIFGGIFRPVYLEANPKEYVERSAISAQADGSFAMDVYLKNITTDKEVKAEIFDRRNTLVATMTSPVKKGEDKITLESNVKNINPWTSETPYLYSVKVSLLSGKNSLYETREKFGFRTIQIKHGDGIYINGRKVKFKGINRHCFWPETGRSLNPSIDLMDIKMMKDMNMNAVRCSHYPPDQSFLDLCDSLGLYVLDELAGWQNAYDTQVGGKLVREMVTRDVNHPSIIFWSNGNEGGTNKELDDDYGLYDPSNRPVIHAHHRPGNDYNGIDTNHYESYSSAQKILQDSLIYMPTEFLHSQDDGGAGSSLGDYWELMWNSQRSGGGFLWALLDEGIVRTDLNGYIDVNRVNAPDGVLGPHREKEGSYNAIKEIWSPIVIRLKDMPSDFKGELEVENRFHFTNLNKCKFNWKLVNFRKPAERERGYEVMKEGTIEGPAVKPVAKGKLKLPLPADWKNYDGLVVTAFDPFGNEILTWSWKLKDNAALLKDIVRLEGGSVDGEETDSTLTVKANGLAVQFNKKNGEIISLKNEKGLDLLFGKGPVSCNGISSVSSFTHSKEGNNYSIDVNYSGDLKSAHWKMYGSGWLELTYEYTPQEDFKFAGISFVYPESNIIGAKWMGNGPYRVWKNRLQGVTYNVWENLYNDTQTGFFPWLYPEFKGYFSNITWVEINTSEGSFLVASKENNLFVRLFDFTGISGPDKYYPALPPGNISFLDGIPPIGTKLATGINASARDLGPASLPNKSTGPVKRTLYFYFGYPESGK